MDKLVLFGAGKIGRSFIAQLFSRAGFETVFIDIDASLVNLLNEKKTYNILIKDTPEELIRVKAIRALHFSETVKIVEELATARIAAISVGQKGLPAIYPLLAAGLQERYRRSPASPLDIIIAENIRNADTLFRIALKQVLPDGFPLDDMAGFVESSIGKMVPVMTADDLASNPLLIFAEAYNELPVDARAFKNKIPEIEGLMPKNNMKAWVDRKSFIHNLGHAAAAYFGYQKFPGEKLLWKVLDDNEVREKTRKTMMQSAEILAKKYASEFTVPRLEEHVDDLLRRFQNKALGDTVHRVGCDLYRKLDKNDRLAGAIYMAQEQGLPFNHILDALYAGFLFEATDHEGKQFAGDEQFHRELKEKGLQFMFRKVTGLYFA